ncbi:hypothetical protein YSY43_28720 [Paenibacillus sp. YSY-4.3]
MNKIPVTELKPGLKIISNVHSPLGGLLLQKGKVLLPRDLDILRAFLISEVEIEEPFKSSKDVNTTKSVQTTTKAEKASVKASSTSVVLESVQLTNSTLHQEYDRMLHLTKSAFQSILAAELPIYELRRQLEALLSQLKHYKVLTFTPRNMNEYDYLYHNAILSAMTSYLLAQWYGLPQKDWMQVAFAGLLHDIGNTKIDPLILYNPNSLTESEAEEMRMHTTYGYQQLRKTSAINEGVRLTALQHHEKMDGSGYPFHLVGDRIHIYARIVAVADIFHAMTLNRRYRKAQSPYLVLEQLKSEAFGKLDPSIVQTFVEKVTQFHNGMKVLLSNGTTGEIVFSDRNHPTRPMVSVDGEIINLIQNTSLYIEEVLS